MSTYPDQGAHAVPPPPSASPARRPGFVLLLWVLAITSGSVIAASIIPASAEVMDGIALLPGMLAGICVVALGELLVLWPHLRQDRALFFFATVVGGGWAALSCLLLGLAGLFWFFDYVSVPVALPLGGAIFGAITSGAQWLVLRRHFASTGWWVPAHVLAGLAGTVVLVQLGGMLHAREGPLSVTLLVVALASAVAALITAPALLRMSGGE